MEEIGNQDNWVETPMHLLDLILKKSGQIKDGLQFGAVCESWHCVFMENQRRLVNIRHQNQIPMLLILEKGDFGAWRAYDVVTDKFLDSKPCVSYNKRFCGSSRGWLAEVNADWSMTLRNPFSSNTFSINLPPIYPPDPEEIDPDLRYEGYLDFDVHCDDHVFKVLITADPLRNPDKCFVIVIFHAMSDMAFAKVPHDEDSSPSSWTLIPNSEFTKDIMHCGTQLYSVNSDNEVHSFNLEDPYNSTLKLVVPSDNSSRGDVVTYLVQSHNKEMVYLVIRHFVYDDEDVKHTLKFEIFELDFDTGEVKAAKSINDDVMFLGENSSICVALSSSMGCHQNCIYFTHDTDDVSGFGMSPVVSDVGVYHIPTEKFKFHLTLNEAFVRHMTRSHPIWVEPTFNVY